MRLRETNGDQWELMRLRLMRPMGTHETQRDYWRLMRPMGTHETQRELEMETNGDS